MQLQLFSFALVILHCMEYTGCQQHSSSRHRQHKQISGVSSGCQQGGCLTCSDYNGCLSCKPRFFMHLERIGMKQIGVCMTSCPPGFYGTRSPDRNTCTMHCEVGEWREWSPCSRSGRICGFKRGQETRTRQVLQYPSPFGKPCPEISEIRECLVKRRRCPVGRRKGERRGERRNRNNRRDKESPDGRRERKRERERERDTSEREDSDNRNKTEHRHRRGQDRDPVSPEDGPAQ
ncbi:LOW QUALITY PROTEIN: R-spondin-3 [Lampris incognitus]|uniref:LOW QUALITY PROTEIN: R-spondin-3 n=1 Tax=Lampris incognitus TaxID=2546036 RepID=UPI0024B5F1B3|nr:LOW QUALITY PROTEIN: R-spondin-3 [Lampris incognitus]